MRGQTSLKAGSIALAALVFACGSDDGGSDPDKTDNPWGLAAAPCDIDSGFPGDELCIQKPPPEMGFQMHFGPKNYDDPAEVAKFVLPAGAETTVCMLAPTDNDGEIFLNEFHTRLRPGSHHMLLYVVDGVAPDQLKTSTEPATNCRDNFLGQRNLFGAQTQVMDVKRTSNAPENEGLAVRVPGKQQGVIEVHFVNTSSEPILMEGWANIIYTDPSTVTVIGDPLFFIGGFATVQLGQTYVHKHSATVPDFAAEGLRIVAGTGHYHAHTVRFAAHTVINGTRELLMEDYDYHDPALIKFDSGTTNSPPDPVARIAGGRSGLVHLMPGDRIEWECEVDNTDARNSELKQLDPNYQPGALNFGNQVYEAEMCNMFGMYAPTMGGAWRGGF
jgi:hypothetical protein